MIIGGIHKFSLIDFPGKISAILFTRGCNFRCPYCHNPQLVLPRRYQLPLENKEIHEFLLKRQGRLDGIVITGGEPLLQEDLAGFLRKIKNMGYAVKVDTNGTKPAHLKTLLSEDLVDYIAMDVKAPVDKYANIVKVPVNSDQIMRSMMLIRESGVKYEFRTTIVKKLMSMESIKEISELLQEGEIYYLQNFIESRRVGHKDLEMSSFSKEEVDELTAYFKVRGINCFSR